MAAAAIASAAKAKTWTMVGPDYSLDDLRNNSVIQQLIFPSDSNLLRTGTFR
jgi:hypothetical protein